MQPSWKLALFMPQTASRFVRWICKLGMSKMCCGSPAQMNCGAKLLPRQTSGATDLTACRLKTWAAQRARYYQENAINHVLEAIAGGQQRELLTLATGTGKTFIAFKLLGSCFKAAGI